MTDNDKPATMGSVHGEVLAFARRLLGSQVLATLLLMGLAVVGYRALAAEAHDAGASATRDVAADVARMKSEADARAHADAELHAAQAREAEEQRRRTERVERVTLETALNVRLLLQERGIRPVTLEAVVDGGAP